MCQVHCTFNVAVWTCCFFGISLFLSKNFYPKISMSPSKTIISIPKFLCHKRVILNMLTLLYPKISMYPIKNNNIYPKISDWFINRKSTLTNTMCISQLTNRRLANTMCEHFCVTDENMLTLHYPKISMSPIKNKLTLLNNSQSFVGTDLCCFYSPDIHGLID